MIINKEMARRFLLTKHGLYGEKLFHGENGIMEFIRQAGCIQFDPIDVCGKNHELVLQSRIEGFKPKQLGKLLYEDRKLIDCWDKNMAILPVEDWPFMERRRIHSKSSHRNSQALQSAGALLKKHIKENGPICSTDIDMGKKVDWFWAPTSVARAALEALFFSGELGIHHKKNTKRYYDLIENLIPESILGMEDPLCTEEDFFRWNVLRRIGSVGMLSDKGSDGLLGIVGMTSKRRLESLDWLEKEGHIISLEVEESSRKYYIKSEDSPLLSSLQSTEDNRMEFIAPLDNLMWDRKIIADLFGFEYKWEIYTPETDRKHGYYVLPILHGDVFAGRIEIGRDRKADKIFVKGLWWEPGIKVDKALKSKLKETLIRFGKFNGTKKVEFK